MGAVDTFCVSVVLPPVIEAVVTATGQQVIDFARKTLAIFYEYQRVVGLCSSQPSTLRCTYRT
jgi:hypothetical protein